MEIRLAYNDKISTSMSKIRQYSLSITIDNEKRKLICRAPIKAQFTYYELISINFIILELLKFIHFYIKHENQNLFENQRKFEKVHAKRKMTTNFLKLEILVT